MITSKNIRIIAFDDNSEVVIPLSSGLNTHTVVVQPLNIAGPLSENPQDDIVRGNAATGVTGTVSVNAEPFNSFVKYPLDTGAIDLANPSFITVKDAPVSNLYLQSSTVSGCTHLAITVVSQG